MQFKVALMVPDVSTMIGRFFDIQLDYDVTIINVIGTRPREMQWWCGAILELDYQPLTFVKPIVKLSRSMMCASILAFN